MGIATAKKYSSSAEDWLSNLLLTLYIPTKSSKPICRKIATNVRTDNFQVRRFHFERIFELTKICVNFFFRLNVLELKKPIKFWASFLSKTIDTEA